jgi:hypothetical protein
MAKRAGKPSNRRLYRLLLESLLERRSQPLSRVGQALADKAEVAIVRALTTTDPATTDPATIEKAVKRLLSELQRLEGRREIPGSHSRRKAMVSARSGNPQ